MKDLIKSIRQVRKAWRFQPDGDPGPPIDPAGRQVVLHYLFPALGDAVLLAPAVQALLDTGVESVGLVLRKSAIRIWKHLDLPVKLHPFPDELVLPLEDPRWQDPELRPLIEKLAKPMKKYDVAVDLTLRDEVDVRRFLADTETRLGFIESDESTETAGLTWGTLDERFQAERHWSRYLILPLRSLGVEEPNFNVSFSISDKAQEKAESLWGPSPRVLLVPGAQTEEKRWSPDQFAEVGRFVGKQGGSTVVCGAPEEGGLIRSVVKAIGKSTSSPYTQKNLETLLALVRSADAVVSNDTGPMHFAFLMNVPTVAVFTYMSPICWGPPRKDPRFVVLNAPSDQVEASQDIWTRAVLHYLEDLLP